ncbi:phage portal protein [Ruminococcus sp.]|uniref:phage portal protein n=1 Tax=Ruminococcus sp. TaxID=41978 RepID=UPI0039A198A5
MLNIGEIQTLLNTIDNRKAQAKVGRRYYHAAHDIQDYRLFYYDAFGELQEDHTRSNIKIAHPFFTELVDQEIQYLLSNRDRIVTAEDTELQKEMDRYFNENDRFRAELADACTDAVVCGWGWLYAYVDTDDRLSFQCADSLSVTEADGRYTSDGRDYVLYRYLQRKDIYGHMVYKIMVMDDNQTWMYTQVDSGTITLDASTADAPNPRPHVLYKKHNSDDTYFEGLGFLPWFRIDNNREQVSGLQPIKALIDDYDLMSCGLSNNLQDASEYLVVVSGFPGTDMTELMQNLKTKKVIGTADGGGVEMKTVTVPYEARKVKLELDKENIYQFGMGFDASQVGDGNVTNVVIKSRYALLDIKCDKLETHLRQTMGGILDVVLERINQERGTAYTRADVKMDFTRSCITNDSDNATIESTEATTAQTKINTLLAAAAQVGIDPVLPQLCNVLDLDESEVRKAIEQADSEQLDSMMQQLEEGAANDTGAETDNEV